MINNYLIAHKKIKTTIYITIITLFSILTNISNCLAEGRIFQAEEATNAHQLYNVKAVIKTTDDKIIDLSKTNCTETNFYGVLSDGGEGNYGGRAVIACLTAPADASPFEVPTNANWVIYSPEDSLHIYLPIDSKKNTSYKMPLYFGQNFKHQQNQWTCKKWTKIKAAGMIKSEEYGNYESWKAYPETWEYSKAKLK